MKKYFNKVHVMIDKIGKHNFILIVFIVVMLITTSLYQTFSLYTESGGVSLIDGIKTYSFILNASNTTNSVVIAAGNSKNIDITISNDNELDLKYGLYYSTESSDINVWYLSTTNSLPNGIISSGSDLVVSVIIENSSSSNVEVNFGVSYGFENGGDLVLEDNQMWLSEYNPVLLSEVVNSGSYVLYTGNNGCEGESCSGQNANYADDSNMGYCQNSNYKFKVNGWRVAYIEGKNVHLVSAGATDCMCTSSDGTASSSSCSSMLSEDDFYKHINNLDNMALKYCNINYVNGGVCDNTTVWAMDDLDFQKITGNEIESTTCFGYSNVMCGLYNSLIDNGGFYYFAKKYSASTVGTCLLWSPSILGPQHSYGSGNLAGVRPVIRLDSSVKVVGGTGTYDDPYVISR